MSKLVDNLIAWRILRMLVTDWKKFPAYKEGIIDANGNRLKKVKDLTSKEKKSYDYLDRLVFNLKRIIEKLPGGSSKLGSLTAAYFLIRECYEGRETATGLQNKFELLYEDIEKKRFTPVDEILDVKDFIAEEGEGPVNAIGSNDHVSVKEPAIRKRKRKFKDFNVSPSVLARFKKGKSKFRKWSEYLDLNDESQKEIYNFATKNPDAVIVLNDCDNNVKKAIRYSRTGGGRWKQIQRKPKTSSTQNYNEELIVETYNF